jgi:hypothetical protein
MIRLCNSRIVVEIFGVGFHLGCLCTLTFNGVGGGVFMYGGLIFKFVVICSVLFLDQLCLF